MRILIVTGEFPPMQGGVGDYSDRLAHALAAQQVEVHVLTGTSAGAPAAAAATPFTRHHVPGWRYGSWQVVQRVSEQVQPDVLLIQYQSAAYGLHPAINLLPDYLRVRWGRRRPLLVTTFHDLLFPYIFPKAGPLRLAVVRRLARRSDIAIATNVEDLDRLQTWGLPLVEGARGRVPRPGACFIPIGSNIAVRPPAGYDRHAARAQWGLGDDDWLLCYFGFLHASKGGEVLVRTLAELVRRGHPAHLLMIGGQVGSSDPTIAVYLARIRQLITELGLDTRVHWTGFAAPDAVSANLLAADVAVLPYLDGAGRSRGSLMAVLAHGLPTVTTQPRRALPSFVDRENVVFVPAGDVAAVVDATVRIQRDPGLRQRLQVGARALHDAYNWPAIAAQHIALFQAYGYPAT